MNEKASPQISPVEIYVGVGRGFYQSGRHSCASTRRPDVAAEQVLIRATPSRSHHPSHVVPVIHPAPNAALIYLHKFSSRLIRALHRCFAQKQSDDNADNRRTIYHAFLPFRISMLSSVEFVLFTRH